MEIKPIAVIHTDFPEKFGLPRQSGLASNLVGTIVFEQKFRDANALKGLDAYDYLWAIWEFEVPAETDDMPFRAMVRPPRLGGNTYMGVFATRSPFRPNHLGMSLLKIEKVDLEKVQIVVSGIDMKDGTRIYDLKPYLPYVEAKLGARGGFAQEQSGYALNVRFADRMEAKIKDLLGEQAFAGLCECLSQDPRPSYQADENRIYKMTYASKTISFSVKGEEVIVCGVEV